MLERGGEEVRSDGGGMEPGDDDEDENHCSGHCRTHSIQFVDI